jgi:translation initiation factor 1
MIETQERRYGKEVTVVKGLDDRDIDLKRLASELKSALACGGTTHKGAIEPQGNHRDRIDGVLAENGLEIR